MGEFETLLIHDGSGDEAGIRTIQLNRPERRNALNPQLIRDLLQALAEAAESRCGVVILTGAGSAFCAGLDLDHLRSMNDKSAPEQREDTAEIARLLRTLYDFPKPTIAAVNGAAVAGGTGLATICDFTFAVPSSKFGYTEVRIGFVPAIVASFLYRQIGEKKTRDLLLTGRLIDAQEALSLGLITQIVAEDELLATANNMARVLLKNSPQAMQMVKRLLSSHAKSQLDTELAEAIEGNAQARRTPDFKEGIQSFLEKRKPVWPSLQGK